MRDSTRLEELASEAEVAPERRGVASDEGERQRRVGEVSRDARVRVMMRDAGCAACTPSPPLVVNLRESQSSIWKHSSRHTGSEGVVGLSPAPQSGKGLDHRSRR